LRLEIHNSLDVIGNLHNDFSRRSMSYNNQGSQDERGLHIEEIGIDKISKIENSLIDDADMIRER
jgi:hypothetical protein